MINQVEYDIQIENDVLTTNDKTFHLVVWNDDFNTFDWVINTLIEVCKHTNEQAEQCTLLIHHKGKCIVKESDYDTVKSMCDGITSREISATVEEVVS